MLSEVIVSVLMAFTDLAVKWLWFALTYFTCPSDPDELLKDISAKVPKKTHKCTFMDSSVSLSEVVSSFQSCHKNNFYTRMIF